MKTELSQIPITFGFERSEIPLDIGAETEDGRRENY